MAEEKGIILINEPIDNSSQDKLGRGGFAESVAQTIKKYAENYEEGFVIGLYGSWGSGKTSLINMIHQNIWGEQQNTNEDIIKVDFKPWYFSDQDNLLKSFFNCLSQDLSSKWGSANLERFRRHW